MQAKEAIGYGLADKIIDSQDAAYEKRVMFSLIKTNKFFADIWCFHVHYNNKFSQIRITIWCLLNKCPWREKQEVHKQLLLDLGELVVTYKLKIHKKGFCLITSTLLFHTQCKELLVMVDPFFSSTGYIWSQWLYLCWLVSS